MRIILEADYLTDRGDWQTMRFDADAEAVPSKGDMVMLPGLDSAFDVSKVVWNVEDGRLTPCLYFEFSDTADAVNKTTEFLESFGWRRVDTSCMDEIGT